MTLITQQVSRRYSSILSKCHRFISSTKQPTSYRELREEIRGLVEKQATRGSNVKNRHFKHYVRRFCDAVQAGLREKYQGQFAIDPVAVRQLDFDLGYKGASQGRMPDFSNILALRGYALNHFGRARLLANLMTFPDHPEWLPQRVEEIFSPSSSTINIASLGGGPGFDTVSFAAFNEFREKPSTLSTTVYEYEPTWKEIVGQVEEVVQDMAVNPQQYQCDFGPCDITLPLEAAKNELLAASLGTTQVFTCSYTIAENAVKLRLQGYPFFRQLFHEVAEGTLFLFTDTTHRLWPDIIDLAASHQMRVSVPHLRSGKAGWQLAMLKDSSSTMMESDHAVVLTPATQELYERFQRDNEAHEARLKRGWRREKKKDRGAKQDTNEQQK